MFVRIDINVIDFFQPVFPDIKYLKLVVNFPATFLIETLFSILQTKLFSIRLFIYLAFKGESSHNKYSQCRWWQRLVRSVSPIR